MHRTPKLCRRKQKENRCASTLKGNHVSHTGSTWNVLEIRVKKQKREIEAIQKSLKKSPLLQAPQQQADMGRKDKERQQVFSYAQMAQFPIQPTLILRRRQMEFMFKS